MGCNCGRKGKPTGWGTTPKPSEGDKGGASKRATGARQSFVLTTRDGKTQTFGSELEARAARVRAGGGTIR